VISNGNDGQKNIYDDVYEFVHACSGQSPELPLAAHRVSQRRAATSPPHCLCRGHIIWPILVDDPSIHGPSLSVCRFSSKGNACMHACCRVPIQGRSSCIRSVPWCLYDVCSCGTSGMRHSHVTTNASRNLSGTTSSRNSTSILDAVGLTLPCARMVTCPFLGSNLYKGGRYSQTSSLWTY
jgi:hypothetical protein